MVLHFAENFSQGEKEKDWKKKKNADLTPERKKARTSVRSRNAFCGRGKKRNLEGGEGERRVLRGFLGKDRPVRTNGGCAIPAEKTRTNLLGGLSRGKRLRPTPFENLVAGKTESPGGPREASQIGGRSSSKSTRGGGKKTESPERLLKEKGTTVTVQST